jgi:hypothetical protein
MKSPKGYGGISSHLNVNHPDNLPFTGMNLYFVVLIVAILLLAGIALYLTTTDNSKTAGE